MSISNLKAVIKQVLYEHGLIDATQIEDRYLPYISEDIRDTKAQELEL